MKTTFATLFFVSAILPLIADAGQIKVCAAVDSEPLAGATVKCWDDDLLNADDFMAGGTTASNGCATLNYKTKSNRFWRCSSWDGCWGSNPDIFCEVSGDCIAPYTTENKDNQNQNQLADFGTVNVVADTDFCGDRRWNGCGPSTTPDWLSDVGDSVSGFRDECNSHDVCYGNCDNLRAECEDAFLEGTYAQCDDSNSGPLCYVLANLFHAAVFFGGENACREARDDCTVAQQNDCTFQVR